MARICHSISKSTIRLEIICAFSVNFITSRGCGSAATDSDANCAKRSHRSKRGKADHVSHAARLLQSRGEREYALQLTLCVCVCVLCCVCEGVSGSTAWLINDAFRAWTGNLCNNTFLIDLLWLGVFVCDSDKADNDNMVGIKNSLTPLTKGN